MSESPPLGDEHLATEDEHLATELGRVVRTADPVPPAWGAAARAAFGWTAIEAAPARLSYDSVSATGGMVDDRGSGRAGTKGTAGTKSTAGSVPRQVRYTGGAIAVELDLDAGADKLRVVGRLVPGAAVDVVAHWPGGRQSTTSDREGVFRFDELPRRPLCVEVRGDAPVKTGWVVG